MKKFSLGEQSRETTVSSFDDCFPARLLFRATARNMANHGTVFEGPNGRRSVADCFGGEFRGARFSGAIQPAASNEWRLHSPAQDGIFSSEGLITLRPESGATILVKYNGRGGPRYKEGEYRIGMTFEADDAELSWLHEVCAVGYAREVGDDLELEVYELLGQASEAESFLAVEPLYSMKGRDSVGERLTIHGLIADRYLTMAEEGCVTTGAVEAAWLKGMSWGPHRMSRTETSFPWHIDMRAMMRTTDSINIIQQYVGTVPGDIVSPSPDADRSWRTAAVYETEATGRLSWLNGILAAGIGWQEDNEARYLYYTLL